jgi:predicted acyltransferase
MPAGGLSIAPVATPFCQNPRLPILSGSLQAAETSTGTDRIYALDALRGTAILAMLLSGQVPFGEHALPAWMYHAQEPPPSHEWIGTLPGITWVDLVFPFFLFSMGAAFPLALSRRLEKGQPLWKICIEIGERGLVLAFFALYVQAIRPHVLSEHPGTQVYLGAILGFALLFPVLSRLPASWPHALRFGIRLSGWAGAILFLASARYPGGGGFSPGRSDIIIVVLANMAVFGSLLWLFTRERWVIRLGVLGILLAIRLSNMPRATAGWVHDIWVWSPTPWIYKLYYCQYLFVIVPGTIAGDLLMRWLKEEKAVAQSSPEAAAKRWRNLRYWLLALLMMAMVVVALCGLEGRWLRTVTACVVACCVAGWMLVKAPHTNTEKLFRSLFGWASYWLILGLFFEPYEGGIKKDKATMSYYFVTVGLALCVLISLMIVIDVFKRRQVAQLLIENGQNPMIAYAAINNLVLPILALTAMDGLLTRVATSPWLGFWKAVFITACVAFFVSFCTKRKIFWRT